MNKPTKLNESKVSYYIKSNQELSNKIQREKAKIKEKLNKKKFNTYE